MKDNRIRYYESFEDDFYQADKKYILDEDYEYLPRSFMGKIGSCLTYALAAVFAFVYCPLFLHVRFVGREKLKKENGAFFLYGNHTQPIGDVFDPALACFPKRIYTVVSPANLHLPVIGKLIRPLGGLPLPSTVSGLKRFNGAMKKLLDEGHPIVIYPEAHLWDYYTGIRPFASAAFSYPVKYDLPVYCLTTTYQKRRFGKKPRLTVYVDGPFRSNAKGKRERIKELSESVSEKMSARAELSNCDYIKYINKTD